MLPFAERGIGERHLPHVFPQGALVDVFRLEQRKIPLGEERVKRREGFARICFGERRNLACVEVEIGQADLNLIELRGFAEEICIAFRLRPVLRVAGRKPLAVEIRRLDLLNARFAIKAVYSAVDRQLDVLGDDGAGDGDLVFRAVQGHRLQCLMPADSVQQARGRRRRGEATGQHDGFDEGSHGDSALLQSGSFTSTFVCFRYYITAKSKNTPANLFCLHSARNPL